MNPNDRASRLAHEICMRSYSNCEAVTVFPHQPKNFRGAVGFAWNDHILEQMKATTDTCGNMLPGAMLQEVENDGAGGKTQFATFLGTTEAFRDLGREIIAMTADDFARSGRFPAIMANEINVKSITEENFHLFAATMKGYGQALKEYNLVNTTGETAIMGKSITAFCDTGSPKELACNWGGTCIGLSHRDLLINSSNIKAGMIVVGLNEKGYRCNGGTLLVDIIEQEFGPDARYDKKAISFVKKLIVPSVIYAKTMTRIAGWNPDGSIGEPLAKIVGAAHITGGGMGKLAEILPQGVSAYLDSMPKPPRVLLEAQKMSFGTKLYLPDARAYTTFHGACGMQVLVPDMDEAEVIIEEAKKDNIKAQVVGRTITQKQNWKLMIESQFNEGGTVYI